MTRINLIPPGELSDQHLFAEFREIKMIPKSLRRSINAVRGRGRGLGELWQSIPKHYCLGKGHVSFFYNKGAYLRCRYGEICAELEERGINFDKTAQLDSDNIYALLDNDWQDEYKWPTVEALALIRERIAERIAKQPTWYRWTSKPPPVNIGLGVAVGVSQGHTVYKLEQRVGPNGN